MATVLIEIDFKIKDVVYPVVGGEAHIVTGYLVREGRVSYLISRAGVEQYVDGFEITLDKQF